MIAIAAENLPLRFNSPEELLSHIERLERKASKAPRLWVCGGPGCLAAGSGKTLEALRKEAEKAGFPEGARPTGCLGLCQRGPLILGEPGGRLIEKAKPEDAREIVSNFLSKEAARGRLAGAECHKASYHDFYKPQTRLIMRRFGAARPGNLNDYLETGGFRALAMALGELGRDGVSKRVEESNLRGRGGAGFPAGRKWASCREAKGAEKIVLANGDEGDPGAFMNRALMEGDPLSIIEGMALGAFAVGARRGIIYVRHEYPLSVQRLKRAITEAQSRGLLGDGVLGSDFSFRLEVAEGGGAFVCGESSALMASIEGREGQPRVKYVRSTEKGVWDLPTLLQNVETWANIPLIAEKGPGWFKSIGTPKSPVTKIFSLVGEVRRSGLAEVPLGLSIRELGSGIGGGARRGRTLKAVQSGGPSGGCLPASALDLPLDFDSLQKAGAIMGSGGLIVMDNLSCMVDVARYFTSFLASESCGKCLPCREGLPALLGLLDDLREGKGRPGHAELMEDLAGSLAKSALCGLGQSAANPILSTIRHFKEEYLEHESGFCRAGRCQGMFVAAINSENCPGCGACQRVCPASAIAGKEREPRQVDQKLCAGCGACLSACLHKAMETRRKDAERRGADG